MSHYAGIYGTFSNSIAVMTVSDRIAGRSSNLQGGPKNVTLLHLHFTLLLLANPTTQRESVTFFWSTM